MNKSYRITYRRKKLAQDLDTPEGLEELAKKLEERPLREFKKPKKEKEREVPTVEKVLERKKEPAEEPINPEIRERLREEITPLVEKVTQPPPPTLPPTAGPTKKTDISRIAFQHLKSQGYMTCTWHLNQNHKYHDKDPCPILDKQIFTVDELINGVKRLKDRTSLYPPYEGEGLIHDAPIFEQSHPQCECYLECAGPGLQTVYVAWNTYPQEQREQYQGIMGRPIEPPKSGI